MRLPIIFLFLSLISVNIFATPIVFKYTGTGSGTIGSISFTNADFTITSRGDTDNWESGGGRFIIHESASIFITGVGTTNFTSGTRTWVNGEYMGFGRTAIPGFNAYDLLNINDSSISGWDLLTSFSLAADARLFQWASSPNYSPVTTDMGQLVFDYNYPMPATFNATVGGIVPEPATLALMGLGIAGIGYRHKAK